jgi:hypothetical protein
MRRSVESFRSLAPSGAILGLAAAGVLGFVAGALAFAGDDDDLIDEARREKKPVLKAQDLGANIDRLVYGDEFVEPTGPEERLRLHLTKRVDEITRIARVAEPQKKKLLLAGEGDIRRFVARVDELRVRHARRDFDVGEWTWLNRESQPLRAQFRRGLFGSDSLFAKTLATVLTPEQLERYESIDRERRLFQHRAGVKMTVQRLSPAVGLSDEQQTRLEQFLLKETRPAQITGRIYPAEFFNIVFVQMGRLPREKLQPLFEPWQWPEMQRKLQMAEQFAGGLESSGIILEDDRASQPPNVPPQNPARRRARRGQVLNAK